MFIRRIRPCFSIESGSPVFKDRVGHTILRSIVGVTEKDFDPIPAGERRRSISALDFNFYLYIPLSRDGARATASAISRSAKSRRPIFRATAISVDRIGEEGSFWRQVSLFIVATTTTTMRNVR